MPNSECLDVLSILPPEVLNSNMNGSKIQLPAEDELDLLCDIRQAKQDLKYSIFKHYKVYLSYN